MTESKKRVKIEKSVEAAVKGYVNYHFCRENKVVKLFLRRGRGPLTVNNFIAVNLLILENSFVCGD